MSCGKPHDVDCAEVLERVYVYLDNEMDNQDDSAKIREHLDECGPCLREFGLEQAVKAIVARSCGCDEVPAGLRDRVLLRIRQTRIEITETYDG